MMMDRRKFLFGAAAVAATLPFGVPVTEAAIPPIETNPLLINTVVEGPNIPAAWTRVAQQFVEIKYKIIEDAEGRGVDLFKDLNGDGLTGTSD